MGYSGEKIPDIDVNFSADIFNDIQRYLEKDLEGITVTKQGL